MTSEEWRPVPGTDGLYEVSDQGRVRCWNQWRSRSGARADAPRMVALVPMRGYARAWIRYSDGGKRRGVHQLVLEAFVGPRPEGMVACHRDDMGTNNVLMNLRYDTQRANIADRTRNSGSPVGRPRRSVCSRGHADMRERNSQGRTMTYCYTCTQKRRRARRAERRAAA